MVSGSVGRALARDHAIFEKGSPAEAEVLVRLRAIALLVMYLGIYQAASSTDLDGYFSEHPGILAYVDSVGTDFDVLVDLARAEGYLEDPSGGDDPCDEESRAAEEFARDAIAGACRSIHSALESHFGGDVGLFAAVWNSTFAPAERESLDIAVNSTTFGDGKVEVWDYVSGGMCAWSW